REGGARNDAASRRVLRLRDRDGRCDNQAAKRQELHLLAGQPEGFPRPRQQRPNRWGAHRPRRKYRASRHHLCRRMHAGSNRALGESPLEQVILRGELPSGSGSGSGYGSGYGYGDGSGYGYGYGYGCGCGDGCGAGHGSGDGSGDGACYGYGSGDGGGSGSGSGSGSGYGYGDGYGYGYG